MCNTISYGVTLSYLQYTKMLVQEAKVELLPQKSLISPLFSSFFLARRAMRPT